MKRGSVCALLATVALVLPAGPARAVAAVTGTVLQLADGTTPIEGASVTLASPSQTPLFATTDGNGEFSITPAASGRVSVAVDADGSASQSLTDVQGGKPLKILLDEATFRPLPVFSGPAYSVKADARSGIFYALSSPEVYVTWDYGGEWHRVTMSYDDPDTGLRMLSEPSVMTTSATSGEVAVWGSGASFVNVSTDYGLTWRRIGFDTPGTPWIHHVDLEQPEFFWSHVGSSTNTIIGALQDIDGDWSVWRADLSADAPVFVAESTDPFGNGSVIAFADSTSDSVIGRVHTAGLQFAPLTASDPITFGTAVAGLTAPSPPRSLHLGGAPATSGPPDAAVLVGGTDPFDAQMLTKTAGQTTFDGGSFSEHTTLSADCIETGWISRTPGSVVPTSTGSDGLGSVTNCWVKKSGTGALTVTSAPPTGGTDLAWDADWGSGNFVMFHAREHGPGKSANLDENGYPEFPFFEQEATPGSGTETGGRSVVGYTSPIINDTTYGPGGAQEFAVSMMHVAVATKDLTQGVVEVLPRTGTTSQATQWWEGATGDWLLFAQSQTCNSTFPLLAAFHNWNGTDSLPAANVAGSTCPDFGGPDSPDGWGVNALEHVPADDTIFIGLGHTDDAKHLFRADLTPGDPPSLANLVELTLPVTDHSPVAMAYCDSTEATAASIRDVLFVAADNEIQSQGGALIRITGATTGSPSASIVDEVPHSGQGRITQDVRADCASGVVYAGGTIPMLGNDHQLYRSTDGGASFTPIFVPSPYEAGPIGIVNAIGINPAATCPAELPACDITIAAQFDGLLANSTDAGATWTYLTNPPETRPSRVGDIEFPPGAGGSSISTVSLDVRALLGTDAGAYEADVDAVSGIIATSYPGSRWVSTQVTEPGTDNTPAMVVSPSSGRISAVFARSGGLALAHATARGWTIPASIPETQPGDIQPSLARDSSGRLYLAFARTAGLARGIYRTVRNTLGVWSLPVRTSTSSTDASPSVAVTGSAAPRMHVIFARSSGSSPGLYYATNKTGSWTGPGKVAGTALADTAASYGGPSLVSDAAGKVRLAFARASGSPGIYFAVRSTTTWTALKRLTTVSGDRMPSLVVDANGVNRLVFRRPSNAASRGLFLMRGSSSWSIARVPGTYSYDTQPDLFVLGSTLRLVFVRASGSSPGIYYDRRNSAGWLTTPSRRTKDPDDRNPVVRVDAAGKVTIVFERE